MDLETPDALNSCPKRSLTTPGSQPKEVLVFNPPSEPANWLQMDWSQITTLAISGPWPPPADLYCHAHAHGVKVVKIVNFHAGGPSAMSNATKRSAWISQIVTDAVVHGTDGANVDIEGLRGEKSDLNALIKELATEFRKAVPMAQISFDLPAGDAEPTSYDVAFLTTVLDFVLLMNYGKADAVWNTKQPAALANCPYDGLAISVKAYGKYGVKADQIVVGLPWYGYTFPCHNQTAGSACAPVCTNGRDTCGQSQYAECMRCRDTGVCRSENGVINATKVGPWNYDTTSVAVWFEFFDATGGRYQQWYDDEVSLSIKYRACRALGTKGVAMWYAGSLEYGSEPAGMNRTATMWAALREFTHTTAHEVKRLKTDDALELTQSDDSVVSCDDALSLGLVCDGKTDDTAQLRKNVLPCFVHATVC